jgi:hypothetical protein
MRFGFTGIKNDKYLALKGKMQNKKLWQSGAAEIKKAVTGTA